MHSLKEKALLAHYEREYGQDEEAREARQTAAKEASRILEVPLDESDFIWTNADERNTEPLYSYWFQFAFSHDGISFTIRTSGSTASSLKAKVVCYKWKGIIRERKVYYEDWRVVNDLATLGRYLESGGEPLYEA
jgi:hypothetical protein